MPPAVLKTRVKSFGIATGIKEIAILERAVKENRFVHIERSAVERLPFKGLHAAARGR
jgi:hypothetical protein